MAAKAWYQVRPGRSVMVEFTNGDVKIVKSGSIFEETTSNRCVARLLRGKRPRLRRLEQVEVDQINNEDFIVVLPDSVS